jgi:hypothetical protein
MLKFANAELATEICSITNQIFEELNIPDTLKRGILTPVLPSYFSAFLAICGMFYYRLEMPP